VQASLIVFGSTCARWTDELELSSDTLWRLALAILPGHEQIPVGVRADGFDVRGFDHHTHVLVVRRCHSANNVGASALAHAIASLPLRPSPAMTVIVSISTNNLEPRPSM
jgi:hypothetical protein